MLAGPPSEFALERFDGLQHRRRVQAAFDQRYGVGEIASRPADGRVEHDGRSVEQAKILVEARYRRFNHLRRSAEASVRPVGA